MRVPWTRTSRTRDPMPPFSLLVFTGGMSQLVSAPELADLLERGEVKVLDVQYALMGPPSHELYAVEHLPGAPHLPLEDAFSFVDEIIADIVSGICETITQPSLINLDYADLCTIMRSGGASFMFVGEASMKSSPEKIVRAALKNPLLDVDYRGAGAV